MNLSRKQLNVLMLSIAFFLESISYIYLTRNVSLLGDGGAILITIGSFLFNVVVSVILAIFAFKYLNVARFEKKTMPIFLFIMTLSLILIPLYLIFNRG